MTWRMQSLNARIINSADYTNIPCSIKNVSAVEDYLNSELEKATLCTWFIQNGMKPNPEKYQAMILSRTENKLLFKSGYIGTRQ